MRKTIISLSIAAAYGGQLPVLMWNVWSTGWYSPLASVKLPYPNTQEVREEQSHDASVAKTAPRASRDRM